MIVSLLQNKPAVLLAVALLVMGSGSLVGAGTRAVFTDTATSTGNAFTTGTVTLRLTDADQTALSSVGASVGGTGMAPGDLVSGFIEVSNTGSLPLRYAITTTDTSAAGAANAAVSAALTVGVDTRASGTACTAAQGGASQTQVVAAGTALATLAIGNPAQGSQANDRTLAAGAAERLCFYATLPVGTGNAAQGGTASYTFTFAAEQTANN